MTSPFRATDQSSLPHSTSRPTAFAPPQLQTGFSSASSGEPSRIPDRRASNESGTARARTERGEEMKSRNSKIDQIVSHFYSKTCAVISQARMTNVEDLSPPTTATGVGDGQLATGSIGRRGSTGKKFNKWFNLELEETDLFRNELKTWKSVSSIICASPTTSLTQSGLLIGQEVIAPMIMDIILDTKEMSSNQVLVLGSEDGNRSKVDLIPNNSGIRGGRVAQSNIILETWTLKFSLNEDSIELPSVYKNAIILFRNLFLFIRILPSFSLFNKLNKSKNVIRKGLQIIPTIRTTTQPNPALIPLHQPLSANDHHKITETIKFNPIITPLGSLSLECTYRLNTDFSVEHIETLLSSRFIDEDFFKPNILRNPQQLSRPESLPIRSIPSPPTPQSFIERASSTAIPSNSYGSLSSRRAIPFPSTVDPRLIPLPKGFEVVSPIGSTGTGTEGSRSRYGSYHTPGVEPAFVSLERARVASANVQAGVSPIQRNIPVTGGRRQSLSGPGNAYSYSPSSSSPISRAGSYISSSQQSQQANSNTFAPSTRLSTSPGGIVFGQGGSARTSSAPHVTSLLSIGARSPLAPPITSEPPSGLSFGAPKRPGLAPLSASPASTIELPSGAMPMRQYSNSFSNRTNSRSFGQPSSFGSNGEPESLGRKAARISFEGRGSGNDREELNDFLGMIDATRLKVAGGNSMNGSSFISNKGQAEEELKKLQKSFITTGEEFDSIGVGAGLRRKISRSSIQEEEIQPGTSSGIGGEARPLTRRMGFTPPTQSNSFNSSPVPNHLSFPIYFSKSKQLTTGFDLKINSSSTNSINSLKSTGSEVETGLTPSITSTSGRFEEEIMVGLDLSEEEEILLTNTKNLQISPAPVVIPLPNLLERGRSVGGSTVGGRSRDVTPNSTSNFKRIEGEEFNNFPRW